MIFIYISTNVAIAAQFSYWLTLLKLLVITPNLPSARLFWFSP
ncbi:hypothetical protein [aff. Roholtiella sp. LEGE 12411]|nr:hypothetical protein [aff. Roholtiella sp. LEGE 12411]